MRFRLIAGYVVKEFLFSFLVAFLFFFFIFFVNQILVLAEEIFSKHVPLDDVARFVIYSLPAIVALAFPFGSLVGALMAVGRLSSDNEILAFKALGVPLLRLFLPLVAMGVIFSFISFVANDYFLPLGNIRLAGVYRKILYTHPGVELEPYSVKKYEDSVLITGPVEGNAIRNLVIIDRDADNRKRVISARQASLAESDEQKGVISLRLTGVFSQAADSARDAQVEYTSADEMIYNILLKDISATIMNPGPREMSSVDVWRDIREKQRDLDQRRAERDTQLRARLYALDMEMRDLRDHAAAGEPAGRWRRIETALQEVQSLRARPVQDRNLQIYKLEFYKKFSFPLSCLIFIAFAFPVGLYTRRAGRTMGFGIGLLMASLYWGLLFTGHTLGLRLQVSPFLAMWFPNLVVLAAAVILHVRRLNQ